MSNLIPPLVSSSPPPMVTDEPEDLEDDEFGDFTAAADLSFEVVPGYSLPTTPQHASYSNFTSNSFQTQSNLIISPKMKNHLETNKVSENIFCDIKDVNTTFVNNNKSEDKTANQDVQSKDFEVFVPRITDETSCDKIQDPESKNDDFGDFNCFSSDYSSENLQDESHSAKTSLNVKSESDLNEFNAVINIDSIIEPQEIIVPNNETINETESKVLDIKCSQEGIDISKPIMESENTDSHSEKVLETKSDEKSSELQEIPSKTDDFGEFESTVSNLTVEEIKLTDHFPTNSESNLSEPTEILQTNLENIQTNEENKQINKDIEEITQTIEENDQTTTLEDDFGDFNYTPAQNEINNHITEDAEDEFSDFTSPVTKKDLTESNINAEEVKNEDDDFGDFNFSSKKSSDDTTHPEEDVTHEEDEFGDFNVTQKEPKPKIEKSEDDFDEFGDFNDYTQEDTIEFTTNFDLTSTESAANAEQVINNIFTGNESDLPDIEAINFIETTIFKQLHDIENTNALNYQWATSDSQKTLLRALNIDSRNILFGPRWNASMPRFAANLGFAPLEPVKSDLPAPGASTSAPVAGATPLEPTNCEVPAAKFDWTSSGLVNPLDSQSTESVKQIEDKLNLNQPETKELRRDSTEYPRLGAIAHLDFNILNSDNESVNSLKFNDPPPEIEDQKPDSDDGKPEKDIWRPNLLPQKVQLKESHISCEQIENKVLNIQQFELESTIVTPELTRKTIQVPEVEDDDFTDFQMSLPEKKPIAVVSLEPLKPIVLEPAVNKINWPEPGVINENIGDFEFYVSENKPEVVEDDWSDFVSAQQPQKMPNHLELSVPNLQNNHLSNKTTFIPNSSPTKTVLQQQIGYSYQQPYQIPLQTINTPFGGLPQTSLSSYNNFSIGPTELSQNLPQKTRKNDFNIFDGPFNSEIKPFQSNNPPNLVNNQPEMENSPLQSVESTFLKMQQPCKEFLNDDDDDWTEFVSSQPAGNTNGQLKPNIIANPVHFDAFQTFQSSSSKSSVPSISALPELDFIAPKNKFFSKK